MGPWHCFVSPPGSTSILLRDRLLSNYYRVNGPTCNWLAGDPSPRIDRHDDYYDTDTKTKAMITATVVSNTNPAAKLLQTSQKPIEELIQNVLKLERCMHHPNMKLQCAIWFNCWGGSHWSGVRAASENTYKSFYTWIRAKERSTKGLNIQYIILI